MALLLEHLQGCDRSMVAHLSQSVSHLGTLLLWKKKHVLFHFHPLFGLVWLLNLLAPILAGVVLWLTTVLIHSALSLAWLSCSALGLVVWIGLLIALNELPSADSRLRKTFGIAGWALPKYLLRRLDLTEALLNPYELKRQLHDLFVAGAPAAVNLPRALSDVHLLVLCAVLEELEQVCLRETVPIVEALSAALAVPGLFPPAGMRLHSRLV